MVLVMVDAYWSLYSLTLGNELLGPLLISAHFILILRPGSLIHLVSYLIYYSRPTENR